MLRDKTLNLILRDFSQGVVSGREFVRRLRLVNELAGSLVYAELKERGVDSTRNIVKMAIRRSNKKSTVKVEIDNSAVQDLLDSVKTATSNFVNGAFRDPLLTGVTNSEY